MSLLSKRHVQWDSNLRVEIMRALALERLVWNRRRNGALKRRKSGNQRY